MKPSLPAILYIVLAVVPAAIVGASWPASAAPAKLVITGASTIAPLAAEIGKRFERINAGVQVDVQSGGSSRGVNDARLGLAGIGMASRALNKDEAGMNSYTIAMDGICVIVNRNNPVQSLTDQQIIDIYTGRIGNWREVGGRDERITVVNKAEGRSTLELFLSYLKLTNRQIKAHVIIGDNQQGIKTVTGNRGAIGYVSIGTAEFEHKRGAALKVLPMGGIEASTANVLAGKFPLSRPLNLVTKGEPVGWSKRFIEFAQSEAAHDLVKAQYFVPVAAAQ